MIWNKDRSDIATYKDIINHHLKEEHPTMCIMNESNVTRDDKMEELFPGYTAENKSEKYHKKARASIHIKENTVNYERDSSTLKKTIFF